MRIDLNQLRKLEEQLAQQLAKARALEHRALDVRSAVVKAKDTASAAAKGRSNAGDLSTLARIAAVNQLAVEQRLPVLIEPAELQAAMDAEAYAIDLERRERAIRNAMSSFDKLVMACRAYAKEHHAG